MLQHAWAAAALLLFTAISFLHFPGHTYLQADTQIYVPILERLWDPTVFEQELIAQKPHVAFTIYDEATLVLRKLINLSMRDALYTQQIVFRFAALLGIYLLGLSLRRGTAAALLIAACFGLGATIVGPSVLIFEYEPNPRTNAIGLTMLAVGLLAQSRFLLAGCAAGFAFLYHPPAVYPYWIAYGLVVLLPADAGTRRNRLMGLVPMVSAVLLLFLFSRFQQGPREHQEFLAFIDPPLEKMMRERASYNWVSLWPSRFWIHHLLYWTAAMGALYRLRTLLPPTLKTLFLAMPTIGLLSMPASYLLLEQAKWTLIPQLQPMRALLYVIASAVLLTCIAGIVAAGNAKWVESTLWFMIAFSPASHTRTVHVLWEWSNPANLAAALTVIVIAILVTLACRYHAWPAMLAVALLPYWALPTVAKVRNYPSIHHRELDELALWAGSKTPKDAVFLFPDANRSLYPGIFRAKALRAVYADWKGGGQINFMREFLTDWFPRWEETMLPGVQPDLGRYRRFGIGYIGVETKNRLPGQTPIFENSRYVVYRVPERVPGTSLSQ